MLGLPTARHSGPPSGPPHPAGPIATTPTPIPTRLPAPACFGVACPMHGRCERYAAVSGSAADERTIVSCRVGDRFPLFVGCTLLPAAAAA